ncbi:MAG: T9SS type A sorting domain-containing protein [Ignavibacteriales bacterium]|nr:T9SS type A sorting domain-containing protein [Ignavibacteriales bacterium]
MKSAGYIFSAVLVTLFCINGSVTSADKKYRKSNRDRNISTRGDYKQLDVNAISTYVRNNGSFDRNPGTGNSGFEWPQGSGYTAVYASGLWLGGLVNDSPRVSVAEYSYEYDAGPLEPFINPDSTIYRVYKIRRYDNASTNPDYAEWPFDQGAPALKNSVGEDSLDQYGNRIPQMYGDMTLWTVFNDNNHGLHTNMNTAPLGIEVQMTAFGYDQAGVIGNSLFYKWKLINKGSNQINNAYVSIWSDVDLGDSGNDFDGCDTTLGLGYTYNANPEDGVYGSNPPAVGFDYLQGPLIPGNITDTVKFPDGRKIPGYKFLKMTSFIKYNNDATDIGNPSSGDDVYNYMKGLTRTGLPIFDNTGVQTKFMFPGDPNYDTSYTNWIESGAGGDRRFIMSAGPFNMAVGDTQEIVAAEMIAQGVSNKNSVTVLKNMDTTIQRLYETNFGYNPPISIGNIVISNPVLLADNLNNDGIVNNGERFRFGFNLQNLTNQYNISLYVKAGGYAIPIGPITFWDTYVMATHYDSHDSTTFFEFYVPPYYSDSIIFVPIRIWCTVPDYYQWYDTISFKVQHIPDIPVGFPITHIQGKSESLLNVLIIDQSRLRNHDYQITFEDSTAAVGMTLKDVNSDSILFRNIPLPDKYAYESPLVDGFKVVQGENFNKVGIHPDSIKWISPNPIWFKGYRFFDFISQTEPTIVAGSELDYYLGHVISSFLPGALKPIEIRFDQTSPQKAYRLRRTGGLTSAYVIQETNPFVDVPFSVWDVSEPTPRQLTVSWRDQTNDGTFNPAIGTDQTEVVFIYNRTYNPDGHQWIYQNEGTDPALWSDACTVGPQADIMYGMSIAILPGHMLNESPGVLYVRPWYGLTRDDIFAFNPINLLDVKTDIIPAQYLLEQNYPNPFNPLTTIKYILKNNSIVRLKIFNILGEKIVSLVNSTQQAGEYSVGWNAKNYPSGVYFYRIEVVPASISSKNEIYIQSKKLILLK